MTDRVVRRSARPRSWFACGLGLLATASPWIRAEPSPEPDALAVAISQPLIYRPLILPPRTLVDLDCREIYLRVRVTNVLREPRYVSRTLQGDYEYSVHDALGRRLTWFGDPPPPPPSISKQASDWVRLNSGVSRTLDMHTPVCDLGLRGPGTYRVELFYITLARQRDAGPEMASAWQFLRAAPIQLTVDPRPVSLLPAALDRAGQLPCPPYTFFCSEF